MKDVSEKLNLLNNFLRNNFNSQHKNDSCRKLQRIQLECIWNLVLNCHMNIKWYICYGESVSFNVN